MFCVAKVADFGLATRLGEAETHVSRVHWGSSAALLLHRHQLTGLIVFVGYKGGKIYWLAIHSNQANLIDGGLRHRRHQ
jgi:hypothetical protein